MTPVCVIPTGTSGQLIAHGLAKLIAQGKLAYAGFLSLLEPSSLYRYPL